jgi:hypothetical protein
MTRDIPLRIRAFAQQILGHEAAASNTSVQTLAPALQLIERIRRPLCELTGVGGFNALAKRALTLARAQAPDLRALHVKPDGSLDGHSEILDPDPVAGIELTATLLNLLVTLVGESLMLRIVLDAWPELTAPAPEPSEGSEDDATT